MDNLYINNLIKTVINNSVSNNWSEAVKEWDIVDVEEDITLSESCICGHPNLRYLYTIKNKYTGRILYPIGSSCIKKFNRKELDGVTSLYESLYNLYHQIMDNAFITLDSKYFTRRLIKYFYEIKLYDYNDYDFMLKMFNKRDKKSISKKQQSKINYIIKFVILEYCKNNLKIKY